MFECSDVALLHIQSADSVDCLFQILAGYCSANYIITRLFVVLVVVVVLLVVGATLFKISLWLCHFKSDWDEIWHSCS